jgi:myo-inositol-1(or 4)-monophosphatase
MSDQDTSLLEAAIGAAKLGGSVLREYRQRSGPIAIDLKGVNDYVTEVDRASERAIIGYLRERFPDHSIASEESELIPGTARYLWYIDPLDGTTNFIHGVPVYAVSVGLREDGRTIAGAVYDPVRDETFSARLGGGSFLNGEPIQVAQRESLKGALVSTGFPFRAHDRLKAYLRALEMFILETAGVRRAGSASLDLCYTACGRYDGFWEMSLSPWDIAAGSLIVREAGGAATDFLGKDGYLKTGNIVAANHRIHAAMLEVIRRTMV